MLHVILFPHFTSNSFYSCIPYPFMQLHGLNICCNWSGEVNPSTKNEGRGNSEIISEFYANI